LQLPARADLATMAAAIARRGRPIGKMIAGAAAADAGGIDLEFMASQPELFETLIKNLSADEIQTLCATNSTIRAICNSPNVWKILINRRFGIDATKLPLGTEMSFKDAWNRLQRNESVSHIDINTENDLRDLIWFQCATVVDVYPNVKISSFSNVHLPATVQVLMADNVGLQDLVGLPAGLEELIVSNNEIRSLQGCPNTVAVLDVRFNKLRNLRHLPAKLQLFHFNGNPLDNPALFNMTVPQIQAYYQGIA